MKVCWRMLWVLLYSSCSPHTSPCSLAEHITLYAELSWECGAKSGSSPGSQSLLGLTQTSGNCPSSVFLGKARWWGRILALLTEGSWGELSCEWLRELTVLTCCDEDLIKNMKALHVFLLRDAFYNDDSATPSRSGFIYSLHCSWSSDF